MATPKKKAGTAAKPAAPKKSVAPKATAKKSAVAEVKPTKAAAKPKAEPASKAAAKPMAKTTTKAVKKTASKPATKPAPKAPAKPAAKKAATPAPNPASKAAAKPAPKPAPAAKPAAASAAAPKATKPKAPAKSGKSKSGKDGLTAEEKARAKKLRVALALLKEDKEWPAFLEAQKQLLLKMRDELAPNMQSVTRDHLRSGESNVSSSSGQHIGDAGSEAEVRDLTIRLLDKDREQLFEIDAALERIRRGVYGICEISLELIPKKRLQVRPFCRLTVKCQEEYEKRYGSYANYRARNSDHVGYADLQNDMENAISLDEGED